jgi:myo-inositol-1(or 4)-monophosphatase
MTLNDSLIATGFPYTNFSRMEQYMHFLEWTMRNTHGVRRLGSAAADLIYTACGRVDGFYEYGLKPYDVAAGAFIVEKAGGKVGDFGGGTNWLMGGEIVAANRMIYNDLLDNLKSFGL